MTASLLRESMDEAQLPRGRDRTPAGITPGRRPPLIAVLGLGAVGLPTALALHRTGDVLGIDVAGGGRAQAHAGRRFQISAEEGRLSEADAAGPGGAADLDHLRAACAAVCRHARRGQTIVLTSSPYVGSTRELLIEPLTEIGFEVGIDICVAFSPAPIGGPRTARLGNASPRVLGAAGRLCAEKASAVLAAVAPSLRVVPSPEAAEIIDAIATGRRGAAGTLAATCFGQRARYRPRRNRR